MIASNIEGRQYMFQPGDVVRHEKSSRLETILCHCFLEATHEHAYSYHGVDGVVWTRVASEVEDGRFKLVSHAMMIGPFVRSRGFYVQLSSRNRFGMEDLFLRDWSDAQNRWPDNFCIVPNIHAATYWPTPNEAQAAYENWLENSTSRLASDHRKSRKANQALKEATP